MNVFFSFKGPFNYFYKSGLVKRKSLLELMPFSLNVLMANSPHSIA